ncbi:endonuclease domain-containing protein [Legionella anisa]
MRFWNNDVLLQQTASVIEAILCTLTDS